MSERSVLITGCGIVSAIGQDCGQVLDSLLQVRTGVGPLKYLKTGHTEFPVGEVKLSDEEMERLMGIAPGTPTTRTALMGMIALHEALGNAGLKADDLKECGFVNGTTVGGMDKSLVELQPPDRKHASVFFRTAIWNISCSLKGPKVARCGNTLALYDQGGTDIVVAGGSECITKFHLNGFNSLMILDHSQCRPFDAERAGLNLGEGAAFVVLEEASHAAARNAKALARLSGYGNACDAFHQTASSPDGEGAYLAMSKALKTAGLKPSDIDYVNAHGTGTPNNDESESQAMMRVFGKDLPPVSSTKGMTGHTTSASGAIETVICILALKNGFLPVNYGFSNPMENGIVPNMDLHKGCKLRHVLCNSFGFGGNDSSLVISAVE